MTGLDNDPKQNTLSFQALGTSYSTNREWNHANMNRGYTPFRVHKKPGQDWLGISFMLSADVEVWRTIYFSGKYVTPS